jgi:hypothetical protein
LRHDRTSRPLVLSVSWFAFPVNVANLICTAAIATNCDFSAVPGFAYDYSTNNVWSCL